MKQISLLRTDYKIIILKQQVKKTDNRLSIFNNMNRLNPVDGSRENPQSGLRQKINHYNNPNQNSNI